MGVKKDHNIVITKAATGEDAEGARTYIRACGVSFVRLNSTQEAGKIEESVRQGSRVVKHNIN
jgi:hypothetical protein